jgi:hypothetical protein
MSTKKLLISSIIVSGLLSACGGGSGGDSKSLVIFEGELTQGMGETHSDRQASNFVKHSPGEGIEDVQICALGFGVHLELKGWILNRRSASSRR